MRTSVSFSLSEFMPIQAGRRASAGLTIRLFRPVDPARDHHADLRRRVEIAGVGWVSAEVSWIG